MHSLFEVADALLVVVVVVPHYVHKGSFDFIVLRRPPFSSSPSHPRVLHIPVPLWTCDLYRPPPSLAHPCSSVDL